MDFSPETRTFFQTILTSINQQPKTEIRGNKTLSSQSKANFFPLQIATIQFLMARERRLDLEWSKLGGWFTLGGSSLTESRADAYSGMGNTRLRDTLSHQLLEWATISTGPPVSGNQCPCVALLLTNNLYDLYVLHVNNIENQQCFTVCECFVKALI